jgi:hypothetical protein
MTLQSDAAKHSVCGDAENHSAEGMVEQTCSPQGSWEAEREPERDPE